MKKKQKNHPKSGERSLPFKSVVKYIIWFYIVIVVTEIVVGSFYAIRSMKQEADFVVDSTKSQIDYRVKNTILLLESIVKDKAFANPEIPYTEKAVELNKYSSTLGYMMICLVDKEFNVWDENGTDANLGGRTYMQKLFATGEVQVTDSFASGADGTTLNYTIAVPVLKDGEFDGCIFAAIYFDELEERLNSNIYGDYQQLILFGSGNQVMSMSNDDKYGLSYMKMVQDGTILGTTAKKVEENLFNNKQGSYWGFDNNNLEYLSYVPIENTSWMLFCKLSFWETLLQFLPQILGMIFISTIACIALVLLAKQYIRSQMETVEMLVHSVQELEKKIYQNEKPDNIDFKEIISLTSKGLTDGLTGVITRTVFLNQIPFKLKSIKAGELAVMCFVDVDNLKMINDTYGHGTGDMTLRNVGYVLREYEKIYDGLVGRYGGDEFIMLLAGFESREELKSVVEELTLRLHFEVTSDGIIIPTQCSIGVAVCSNNDEDVEKLIKHADEMLYLVKQNGKGCCQIYDVQQ